MRSSTDKILLIAFTALVLPIAAAANDSSERLAQQLERPDCAHLKSQMRTFLQQNRNNVTALNKLAVEERKRELASYLKALEKAETATTRCNAGKEKETDAFLKTSGGNPHHLSGFYPRLTATLEFLLQNDSSDPYVYEQLTQSYDDLLSAYAK